MHYYVMLYKNSLYLACGETSIKKIEANYEYVLHGENVLVTNEKKLLDFARTIILLFYIYSMNNFNLL